jgi:hypothetical protein
MNELGKMIFIFGLVLCVLGLVLWSGIGRTWIGRLPGDINVTRGNFSMHFPLMTCLVLSVVLSLLAWLFRR